MMAADIDGAWIGAAVGITAAILAGISQIRQAKIAAKPAEAGVILDGYASLLSDLQVEVARLHEEVTWSRAEVKRLQAVAVKAERASAALRTSETACKAALERLQVRVDSLEAYHKGWDPGDPDRRVEDVGRDPDRRKKS